MQDRLDLVHKVVESLFSWRGVSVVHDTTWSLWWDDRVRMLVLGKQLTGGLEHGLELGRVGNGLVVLKLKSDLSGLLSVGGGLVDPVFGSTERLSVQ